MLHVVVNDLGEVYILRGCYREAKENAELALNIFVKRSQPFRAANCRYLLGRIYLYQGQLDAAESQLRGALEVFTELGDRLSIANANQDLAKVHMGRGDYSAAMACLTTARGEYEMLAVSAWHRRRVSCSMANFTAYKATTTTQCENGRLRERNSWPSTIAWVSRTVIGTSDSSAVIRTSLMLRCAIFKMRATYTSS